MRSLDELADCRYEPLAAHGLQAHAEHFALLNGAHGYIALLAEDVLNRPAMFELAAQMSKQRLLAQRRLATREVIRVLHETHRSQQAEAVTDPSELERLADDLLDKALTKSASDVHIEVRENGADVFFRVYGHRLKTMTLSRETAQALAGLLFDVRADHGAKRDIKWSPDQPMDAVINHVGGNGTRVQIRFASAPIYPRGCFQVVCRLLPMDPRAAPEFADLGYTQLQQSTIDEMLIGAQGLVLLVGPTNSGKSTTLQAASKRILAVRGCTIKLESIEDPVEYIIPGACQMPVSLRADFADLLKSTLRHDPDVLMVGEIRDAESAESIKNIVLAGRKVLATLHAYEALAAFQRLLNIGVPQDVLFMSGFVSGIIYQRLLPKLCPYCALPFDEGLRRGLLSQDLVERVARAVPLDGTDVRLHNPDGCAHCRSGVAGYVGRTVCAEIVKPNEALLDALREQQMQRARQLWLASSSDTGYGPTVLGHALHLMERGMVDPRDVENQVGIIRLPSSHAEAAPTSAAVVAFSGRPLPLQMAEPASAMDMTMEDLYERCVA
ncbi:MAG: ATPase, T2SS/T4P/T4SS family [Rhodocyclaceae bacterium]|nr:ATPase, T2SS/T4P/T4SS family [Rhodocyclaceae bacterium]